VVGYDFNTRSLTFTLSDDKGTFIVALLEECKQKITAPSLKQQRYTAHWQTLPEPIAKVELYFLHFKMPSAEQSNSDSTKSEDITADKENKTSSKHNSRNTCSTIELMQ
jgi:hypothetical protein